MNASGSSGAASAVTPGATGSSPVGGSPHSWLYGFLGSAHRTNTHLADGRVYRAHQRERRAKNKAAKAARRRNRTAA